MARVLALALAFALIGLGNARLADVSRQLKAVPQKVTKPAPVRKPQLIYVGVKPTYWAMEIETTWKPVPTVRQGDSLQFYWDKKSLDAPHDVWLVDQGTYSYCNFPANSVKGVLPYRLASKNFTYRVTEKPRTVLRFACGVTYHCEAGMKVQITVSP